jgi:hypothetical protein
METLIKSIANPYALSAFVVFVILMFLGKYHAHNDSQQKTFLNVLAFIAIVGAVSAAILGVYKNSGSDESDKSKVASQGIETHGHNSPVITGNNNKVSIGPTAEAAPAPASSHDANRSNK